MVVKIRRVSSWSIFDPVNQHLSKLCFQSGWGHNFDLILFISKCKNSIFIIKFIVICLFIFLNYINILMNDPAGNEHVPYRKGVTIGSWSIQPVNWLGSWAVSRSVASSSRYEPNHIFVGRYYLDLLTLEPATLKLPESMRKSCRTDGERAFSHHPTGSAIMDQ